MIKSSGFHESRFPESHAGRGEQSAERFPVRFRTPQFGIDRVLRDSRLRLALIFSPFYRFRTDYVSILRNSDNSIYFSQIRRKLIIVVVHKDSIFAVGEGDRPIKIPDQAEIPVIPIVNDARVCQ